jgi:hypothetical protein
MLSNRPNTDSQAKLEELLLKLEQRLMDPVFHKDRAQVSALLAEGFREFGSSGRVWSRDQILNPSETGQPAPLMEDFAVNTIVPELVQVTYRTLKTIPSGKPQAALRSSLWIRSGDRWQMLFHQGTRIPDALPLQARSY